MSPTLKVGQWVSYKLDEDDAKRINGGPPAKRNTAHAGEVFPALIVRVHGEKLANLQVFPDGNRQLWVTSRYLDTTRRAVRTFAWTDSAQEPSSAAQPA